MLNKTTPFTLPHFIFHVRKSWHGTKSAWAEEACTKYGHLRHCTQYTHSCTHILEQVNNRPNILLLGSIFFRLTVSHLIITACDMANHSLERLTVCLIDEFELCGEQDEVFKCSVEMRTEIQLTDIGNMAFVEVSVDVKKSCEDHPWNDDKVERICYSWNRKKNVYSDSMEKCLFLLSSMVSFKE